MQKSIRRWFGSTPSVIDENIKTLFERAEINRHVESTVPIKRKNSIFYPIKRRVLVYLMVIGRLGSRV